jgi:hypothetical protein
MPTAAWSWSAWKTARDWPHSVVSRVIIALLWLRWSLLRYLL